MAADCVQQIGATLNRQCLKYESNFSSDFFSPGVPLCARVVESCPGWQLLESKQEETRRASSRTAICQETSRDLGPRVFSSVLPRPQKKGEWGGGEMQEGGMQLSATWTLAVNRILLLFFKEITILFHHHRPPPSSLACIPRRPLPTCPDFSAQYFPGGTTVGRRPRK